MYMIRTAAWTLLLILGTIVQPDRASSQMNETEFEPEYVGIDCPPDFSSIYFDQSAGMTFHGRSRLTMRQYDEYHASLMYTYAFEGKTTDRKFKITGTHHVTARQCGQAMWSYLTGAPAVIGRLHNATLLSLASNTCIATPMAEDEIYVSPNPPSPTPGTGCGGSGSTYPPLAEDEWYDWYDGVRFRCHAEDDAGWPKAVCKAEP
jgi:hypothetical protein